MSGEKMCEFGCIYNEENEKEHQDSITCAYLFLKDLERRRKEKDFKDKRQKKSINNLIKNARKSLENPECGKCDFSGSIKEVILHEKKCIGFKNEIEIQEKKLYSDNKETCKNCGKIFLHTCSTSLPKHQLKRHAKTCAKTLSTRLRMSINDCIKDIDDPYILKEIEQLCKKYKDNESS